jgi:phospholipid/cholesterol/gamma-HCH transport system substrate-binding protein
METKANYVLIGAFTILVAVFGLLFALWAAKYSADKSFQEYYVIFNEPVTGLTEGGSVQYNGISVGTIEELSLNPRDPRQVRARLKLEASAPVKVDTKAKLSQAGITGSPFIQLTGGSPNAPRLVSNDADTIPVITTEPSALQNIADTASKLVARLDKLMSEENIEHIDNTLTNLDNITAALGDAMFSSSLFCPRCSVPLFLTNPMPYAMVAAVAHRPYP